MMDTTLFWCFLFAAFFLGHKTGEWYERYLWASWLGTASPQKAFKRWAEEVAEAKGSAINWKD